MALFPEVHGAVFPAKGSGMPNHYAGDLLHTLAISGLSRVRTELFELTVIPALAPHPLKLVEEDHPKPSEYPL